MRGVEGSEDPTLNISWACA